MQFNVIKGPKGWQAAESILPLRNRFVHLHLEADVKDWCRWAVRAAVRPEIIAFLRFRPDLLHDGEATRYLEHGKPLG